MLLKGFYFCIKSSRVLTTTDSSSYNAIIKLSLREKVANELKNALKSKDILKANVLKQLNAQFILADKAPKSRVGEADQTSNGNNDYSREDIRTLQSCVQKWSYAIMEYEKSKLSFLGNAEKLQKIDEIIKKETMELFILKSFLPVPYTKDELLMLWEKAQQGISIKNRNSKSIFKAILGLSEFDLGRISNAELKKFIDETLSKNNNIGI